MARTVVFAFRRLWTINLKAIKYQLTASNSGDSIENSRLQNLNSMEGSTTSLPAPLGWMEMQVAQSFHKSIVIVGNGNRIGLVRIGLQSMEERPLCCSRAEETFPIFFRTFVWRASNAKALAHAPFAQLFRFSSAFPSLFPRFSLAFPSLFPKPLFSRLNSLCMHASNLSFRLSLSLYLTHSVGVCQRFFICHTFRKKQNSNIKSFSVCLLLYTRAVGLDSLLPRFITQKIIIKNSVCVCGSFGTAKGR